MKQEITIHNLYLIMANDLQKVKVKEYCIENETLKYNTLIEETSLSEIASKKFDPNSVEAKIWERSVFWVDASGERWTIMLNPEGK